MGVEKLKTFNASDMAHKRTEIFEAAKSDGAIIERKNTNGQVKEKFILTYDYDYIEDLKNLEDS